MIRMMHWRPSVAAIVVCVAALSSVCLGVEKPVPSMKVGFAETDITPELGMEQPGGYGKSYHRTIHDPCKVRAAVFDDGKKRVALVGVDGIAVHREMVQAARATIQEKCGIAAEAILIGASHSHSSGPIFGVRPGEYDDASSLVQKLAYEKSTCVDAGYYDHCLKQIIVAVCQADASRVGARCGVGSGHEDKVAFNRRFRMKNGLSYTHPRQGNPDIVEPAGPIDPEVGVIGAWDKEGKAAGLRGQLRLPRDDQPRRCLGQLDLLPGTDDSRRDGLRCGCRFSARMLWRHNSSR